MPEALIELIRGVLPWILGWFALGGNAQAVQQNIEGFGQALTAGPAKAIGGEVILVTVIGAALTVAVYEFSNRSAKREGLGPIAPPTPPAIATPGFSQSANVGFSGRGVNVGATAAADKPGGFRRTRRRTLQRGWGR